MPCTCISIYYADYKLRIPVEVQDVYELRERTVLNEYRYYREIPKLMRDKYEKAVNVSIICPPNSLRNPSGHPHHYTRHLIEYGPLYHLIVPQLSEQWQDGFSKHNMQAFRANLSGIYMVVSGNSHDGDYYFTGRIAEELEIFQENRRYTTPANHCCPTAI